MKPACLLLAVSLSLNAAEPVPDPKELPRIPFTAAKDARGTFTVKEGFELQLAAAEPLVVDPVAMCFDEFGRLFVVEMIGYSERQNEKLGRVRRLVDTNGDGRFDQSTIFAKGLAWPTALFCSNGGVYVGVTPDLFFFKDTDGDGVSDTQKKIFTGFGKARLNVQGIFNSLRWGLDNRIHGATAHNGGDITQPGTDGKPVSLRGRDFSFDPRTREFRAESSTAQHGMSFDDFGRKFVCSNSSHIQAIIYPSRYAGLNPHYALPSQRVSVASDGAAAPVFRLSPDEPWRIVRTRWRVAKAVRGPVEGGGRVSGYFTAATGITIYRGDALGAGFVGNAFIADAGSNLIHRKLLHYDNHVQPVAERPKDEQKREFIASTDNWFRPVQFANAPDGCLYIADMYRETIEHPWSIPLSIKKHLDLNSGNTRGRIWRIAPKNFKPRQRKMPGNMTTAELAATFNQFNGWHRDTAARLIYERQDKSIVPTLEKMQLNANTPEARIHALWALQGLDALKPVHVLRALVASPRHGLIVAEDFLDNKTVAAAVLGLADSNSAAVRFQFALTASRLPNSDEKFQALAFALGRAQGDRWNEAAVMNALTANLGDLFVAINLDPETSATAKLELLKLIGRRNQPREVGKAMEVIAQRPPNAETIMWVNALGKAAGPLAALEKEALRWMTLPVNQKTDAELIPAMQLVARSGYVSAKPALATVARLRNADAVQVAVVRALAQFHEPQVAGDLLALWPRASGRVRAEILAALVTRAGRVTVLLAALETGDVMKGDVPAATITILRGQKDAKLRARAVAIFGAPAKAKTRAQVVKEYLPALALKGDAAKGKIIFAGRCAICHKHGKEGFALGPDLVTIKTTGREKILTNFIDPNREVLASYVAYNISTKGGEEIVGLLGEETTTHVRIKLPLGQQRLLPRAQVKAMRSAGKSIMPEGLEAGLTQEQMADLLEFISTVK
ncbi:MAG: c-type cytochrome [Verrucomicrobia subdivision 3 bacterium]|nr:c-type cytochrome [Limisphaerales bacterium]